MEKRHGMRLIPIVAYNYGAKEPKRIYQSCRWAIAYAVLLYEIFFVAMEVFPERVLLWFDASEEMLAIGVTALRILAVSYLLSNICMIYASAFQGLGMGVQSMLLTLGRQVVLLVVFIAILSRAGNLPLISASNEENAVLARAFDECRENPVWVWLAFVMAEAVVIPEGVFSGEKNREKYWQK